MRTRSGNILILSIFLGLSSISISPSALAGAPVHWQSPGLLLRIMLAYPKTAEALIGSRPRADVSDAEIHCTADVYRPALDEGWITTADNRLSCSFPRSTNDLNGGTATFSLAETGISAWGNRFDKPVHFSIDDHTSLLFHAALKQAWAASPGNPNLSNISLCGPDGSCTEDFFLNARPDPDSPAALACSQNTAPDGQVTQTRCDFLSF